MNERLNLLLRQNKGRVLQESYLSEFSRFLGLTLDPDRLLPLVETDQYLESSPGCAGDLTQWLEEESLEVISNEPRFWCKRERGKLVYVCRDFARKQRPLVQEVFVDLLGSLSEESLILTGRDSEYCGAVKIARSELDCSIVDRLVLDDLDLYCYSPAGTDVLGLSLNSQSSNYVSDLSFTEYYELMTHGTAWPRLVYEIVRGAD